MLRRTAATIRIVELGYSEMETMFQGRWETAANFRLYVEWASQIFDTTHMTYKLGMAGFSPGAEKGVPEESEVLVDPQDYSAFNPEETLPASSGLPIAVRLSDRKIELYVEGNAELRSKLAALKAMEQRIGVTFKVAQEVELETAVAESISGSGAAAEEEILVGCPAATPAPLAGDDFTTAAAAIVGDEPGDEAVCRSKSKLVVAAVAYASDGRRGSEDDHGALMRAAKVAKMHKTNCALDDVREIVNILKPRVGAHL